MAGFRNIRAFADADEDGKTWITQFQKNASTAATAIGQYIDYSYYAGTPLANFYASSPLEAAYISASRGIYVPDVNPAKQYLKKISVMGSVNAGAAAQHLLLCDYLMYYPFIDTNSTLQQDFIQTVSLPRYSSGRVVAISQSASSTIGQFTITYTNQDGVSGKVSPVNYARIAAAGGQAVTLGTATTGFTPFVELAAGDREVRSIESITFTVTGGGLIALSIIKPLAAVHMCERSIRSGNDSSGAASEYETLIHDASQHEIKQGAILNFLMHTGNSSPLASSVLSGYIETTWN